MNSAETQWTLGTQDTEQRHKTQQNRPHKKLKRRANYSLDTTYPKYLLNRNVTMNFES